MKNVGNHTLLPTLFDKTN